MKAAYQNTDVKALVKKAIKLLEHCQLCPRRCGVNRIAGELGQCQTAKDVNVASFGPHFGEEAELVGQHGSGTIFFAYCNLHCVFCQNYEISQFGRGERLGSSELATIMLRLQAMGCHNINLVSPTHIVPQFLEALDIAKERGLKLPVVYNSGGYDSVETLKLLEGVIDIYMPDTKYGSDDIGLKYSMVEDYWTINKLVLKEMHRQVGDLIVNEQGIAIKGLLVRHLILPNNLAKSYDVLKFIAEEISKNTYVNIMEQYRPCYLASQYPELSRSITHEEYQEVIMWAKELGLRRGF